MSCDGLYLISLKGRKPQRLPAGERCIGLLSCPTAGTWEEPQTKRARRDGKLGDAVNLAWGAWMTNPTQGERLERLERLRSRIRANSGQGCDRQPPSGGRHSTQQDKNRGSAWEKIRQPKKPFPSLPCFWSGRRAWGRLFFEPHQPPSRSSVLSFPAVASNNTRAFHFSSFFFSIMPTGRKSVLSRLTDYFKLFCLLALAPADDD